MSKLTNALIVKKMDYLTAKDQDGSELYERLDSLRPIERLKLKFGGPLFFLFFFPTALYFIFKSGVSYPKIWMWPIGILLLLPWVITERKAKKAQRLYNIIDNLRELLIEKRMRSITQISNAMGSNIKEFIEELKDAQDLGFFQQFQIDRKNMILTEDEEWAFNESQDFIKVHFQCNHCGAQNDVFVKNSDTKIKCEYCDTLNNANA